MPMGLGRGLIAAGRRYWGRVAGAVGGAPSCRWDFDRGLIAAGRRAYGVGWLDLWEVRPRADGALIEVISRQRSSYRTGRITVERNPHSHHLRVGRHSEVGRLYLVTTVTKDRKPIFKSLIAARFLIQTMRREHKDGNAETLAFVVMPDHLHWLFELKGSKTLAQTVQATKSVTAHHLGGNIWQHGFHDHALRRDEDVLKVARYIVANPLRAGLANRLGEYPHWDAIWL